MTETRYRRSGGTESRAVLLAAVLVVALAGSCGPESTRPVGDGGGSGVDGGVAAAGAAERPEADPRENEREFDTLLAPLAAQVNGGELGWSARVEARCGEVEWTQEAPFLDRASLGNVADLYFPDLPAGPCSVTLQVLGEDGLPVDWCRDEVVEVELTAGEISLVTAKLVCTPEAPAGMNVGVAVIVLDNLEPPDFVLANEQDTGKTAIVCNGRRIRLVVVENNRFLYELELEVVDPADAARVRLTRVDEGVFDFLCLAAGAGPQGAIQLVARVRQPTLGEPPREVEFPIHCYEPIGWDGTCDGSCEPEDERALPEPAAAEPYASPGRSLPDCAVLDGGVVHVETTEPLAEGDWAVCSVPWVETADLSLLTGEGQLGVELCLEADAPVALAFYVGVDYPERMFSALVAQPGCDLYTLFTLDAWAHDAYSTGAYPPSLTERFEIALENGAFPPLSLDVRKVLLRCLCEDGNPLNRCGDCGPTPEEVCAGDGQDEDCDGEVEEDWPTLGDPCTVGVGACAAQGNVICDPDDSSTTTCSATPGEPVEELCDSVDNDCDGATDEGLVGAGTSCGVGACGSAGDLVCRDGRWVDTCVPGPPSPEVCDGVDNDCDGETDEGLAGLPTGDVVGSRGAACDDGVLWSQSFCAAHAEALRVRLATEVQGRGYSWGCPGRSNCRRAYGEDCWDAPENCRCQDTESVCLLLDGVVQACSEDWNGSEDPPEGHCSPATGTTTASFTVPPGEHRLEVVHAAWLPGHGADCANPQSLEIEHVRIERR